ncbi:MAG TPA: amino acid adenylation domain-containing protein [Roseiflexaceae bacterium]|nr:amino acid adenylation domain-containing protein [Roseiflexaceae bacterium]
MQTPSSLPGGRISHLLDLLAARQESQSGYTFLDDAGVEDGRMTYAELERRARAIAALLQQSMTPGERALLLYPPGLEYIAGFFGCLAAGVVVVPAYPPDPMRLERTLPRLQAMLQDAQASVVLTTSFIASMAEIICEQAPSFRALRWVATDECLAGAENGWKRPEVNAETLAFLQYTSGSTGTPKGVMLSHRNLLHNLGLISRAFRTHRDSVGVIWLPPYHDMGLIGGILQPLYGDFPTTLMSPLTFLKQPLRWLEAISRYHATISGGPNFAYDLCLRKVGPEESRQLDLSHWEVAFSGAEPIRPETLDRFTSVFGARGFRRQAFYTCYGLAEGTLIVSGGKYLTAPVRLSVSTAELEQGQGTPVEPGTPGARTLVGCGEILEDQQVLVVHPETRQACAPGEVGEIWVSGPNVAQGYWQRPEETEKTFQARLAEGTGPAFLRTGDLGFLRDGELFITGRQKDLIIIRGRNHYPQDIELTVERSHPALRPGCTAAFSVEVDGEEQLVIVQEIDVRKLRGNLRQQLEAAEAAATAIRQQVAESHELRVHALALIEPGSIFKTSSGKIQRRACQAAWRAGQLNAVLEWSERAQQPAEAPPPGMVPAPTPVPVLAQPVTADELRLWLVEKLQVRLGSRPAALDVHQPITRFGLDSLSAVELAHDIERELGVLLSMDALLRGPSIAELARELASQRASRATAPAPRRAPREGPQPLSFSQQRLWFLEQLQPGLPLHHIPVAVRLEGPLDLPALERSFTELVRRHDSLRTAVSAVDGQPRQVIAPSGTLPLTLTDLTVLGPELRESEARRLCDEEARRPFDLERGPLARALLLRIAEQEHLLVLVLHHLVSDGASMVLLTRELGAFYGAFHAGRTPALPEPALQYKDYVDWQREWLQGERLETQLAWWRQHLAGAPQVLELPTDRPRPAARSYRGGLLPVRVPEALSRQVLAFSEREGVTPFMTLMAAFQLLLSRCSGQQDISVGTAIAGRSRAELQGVLGLFINTLVLRSNLAEAGTFRRLLEQVRAAALGAYAHQDVPFERLVEELQPARSQSHSPLFQAMLILHDGQLQPPALAGLNLRRVDVHSGTSLFDLTLTLQPGAQGLEGHFEYSLDLFDAATVARFSARFLRLLEAALEKPEQALTSLPLLPEEERRQVVVEWNATRRAYPRACIHELFETQVARTPGALALTFDDVSLTYAELNARTDALALQLRSLGVGPEVVVGLCVERSLEMVVGMLGILKAGGAYLPLDPAYPSERLALMLEDSGTPLLVTQRHLASTLPETRHVRRFFLALEELEAAPAATAGPSGATPDNLAYVIYTSGSTGRPKGVMVPHRTVANFFVAMDERVGAQESDAVLLAVTSISFDISVLELLWTLSRGIRVILQGEQLVSASVPRGGMKAAARRKMDFSLFYFADDAEQERGDRYRLLFEGARFADRNGFAAVWTPERHFHAFGGLYPNPSVVSAALAAHTERVALRAGSVVLPLHHPVRIAEEWALVDNLSRGRVGVAFASGWNAGDFVFAPERFSKRREAMIEGIDVIRRLWRGEAVSFPDGNGRPVDVRLRPRPLQPSLPIWLTAAGNPETFRQAGQLGAHVLTHLLGQNLRELEQKIALYREAWRQAGHPGTGHVTLMLHTFVGRDAGDVRRQVEEPFRNYLRSSVDLMRGIGRSLGMDLQAETLGSRELDLLSSHAFNRYFETSGLFGTPRACRERVEELRELGVDELGCLIDFGVDTDVALGSLQYLDELRQRTERDARRAGRGISIPEQISRYRVTHLQCTPSLARALMLNPEAASPMSLLCALLVGGEALPASLATQLRGVLSGNLLNMYGPTETTVWSSTQRVGDTAEGASVPIGTPIANTSLYVLDQELRPAPIGVVGELFIGGEGVVRGYLSRPELTAERFLPDPLSGVPGARMYRTGDLARWLPDGTVEFIGRADHQVKLRGFRIELGEIEAVLGGAPEVAQAVVAVREDGLGDKRLVAYVVAKPAQEVDVPQLRALLQARLPEYMVPSLFMTLDALPLTPNGKVDRKALPAPSGERSALSQSFLPPRTEVEQRLADIWSEVLGVRQVGVRDNFFELGGHSLLATQVLARVKNAFQVDVPLVLLFQTPTVEALAAHLESGSNAPALLPLRRVGREQPLPPSLAQERMWFLYQLEPESIVHNVAWLVRLNPRTDVDVLERSMTEMVRRHETLRTTFDTHQGQPVQRIAPPSPVKLPVSDVSHLPPAERERAVHAEARALALRPFDLRRGPLLRVALLQVSDTEQALVMVMHHILTDGWSLGVLARELLTLQQAFSRQQPSPLSELPIQYADFAACQRSWLSEETLAGQLRYWKQALAGIPSVLELPANRPRPAVQSYRGGRQPVQLPASLTRSLQALSQREGTTLFMTLLAAFQVLLHRYSGQEDIVVGTPIAGRGRTQLNDLIGFFLNTLALRSNLAGTPTFLQLLRQVRETALQAYGNQDVPFDKLVEELRPPRSRGHTPIFQVLFIFQEPTRDTGAAEPALRAEEIFTGTTMYDLTLILTEREHGLEGVLEYSEDLFDASTAGRMVEHLRTLLEGIAREPQQRISQLPLLPADERRVLLTEWAGRPVPFPEEACFPDLFEAQVRRTPEAVAASCNGQLLTYRALDATTNRLAWRLREEGVRGEDVVALLGERGLELLCSILGVFKAGGAYLPLDPRHPPHRLTQVLEQSGVRLVLVARALEAPLEQALRALPPEQRPRLLGMEAILEAPGPDTRPPVRLEPSQLAYVIYTSGSTGLPKGAMLEHRGMLNHLHAKVLDLAVTGQDVVAQTASQCFDISVWQFLVALLMGGRTHILQDEVAHDPARLLARLEEDGVTIAETVPSMLRAIVEATPAGARRTALQRLRWMLATGEALSPEVCDQWLAAWPGVLLLNAYGPTECSDDVTHHLIDRAPRTVNVPIGRAIANMGLYVLDGALQPVPIGVPGELYVGGVGVGRGYLGEPRRTAEVFLPDPFSPAPGGRLYKTGDLVRYLPQGVLEFLGRIDQQVKIRGFRIELGEVEFVLKQHEAVAQAVAVAREDVPGRRQLVVYVVPAEGRTLDSAELRRFTRELLPEYMVPSACVVLPALPLNANGKVDRKALPAPHAAGEAEARLAPRTELERQVARAWEEVLGIEQVGIRDNFFELGGHSLLAVKLMTRLQEQLGRHLPVATLFQEGTVEHLAALLGQPEEAGPWSPLVAIQPKGNRRPFFCVHPVGGNVLCYAELARRLGDDQPFYGLQARGLEGGQPPSDTIESMAALYIEAICAQQPAGPYLLGGWSLGGVVAYEMARQLQARGEEVALLALIDTEAGSIGQAPLEADAAEWLSAMFAHDLARTQGDAVAAEPLRRVFESNLQALWRYRPRSHAGPAVLFGATELQPARPEAVDAAWRSLATGGVRYHAVPGDHYTMLQVPHVQVLAERLRAELDEAQGLDMASDRVA